jgi:chemotaxis regulatin CheY-phosphate phosphatase CheZ
MKLSDLRKKTKKISIEIQGDTLNVEYRLNVVTPLFLRELGSIEDSDENITRQLQEVVASWDLLDDEGKEIKPTVELVQSIPRPFWMKLFDIILEDMKASVEQKKA